MGAPFTDQAATQPGCLVPGLRLARPEGSEHAPPTIVIEGVDELVKVLRVA